MGLFSFIGGLIGGGKVKKASRKAEAFQMAQLQKAIDLETQRYADTKQNIQPAVDAGNLALGQQGDLIGINGDEKQQTSLDALKASPFYQSLYKNGLEANLQNASATGGLRGGNETRSLADFGADTFAKTIQQQLANLGGLSSQGLNAGLGLGQLGAQNADQIGTLFGDQGKVRAGGLLQRAGINASMWNSAGGLLDKAVGNFIPGGSTIGKVLGAF